MSCQALWTVEVHFSYAMRPGERFSPLIDWASQFDGFRESRVKDDGSVYLQRDGWIEQYSFASFAKAMKFAEKTWNRLAEGILKKAGADKRLIEFRIRPVDESWGEGG